MRRPGWARLTAGLFALWFALAGAGGLPACPMAVPDGSGSMPGMPGMSGSSALAGGAPGMVGPGAHPAGDAGARAAPGAAGSARGGAHAHARPASGDAGEHAHVAGCACPAACAGAGALLPGADRLALAGRASWLRAVPMPRPAFVAPHLLSHFLPYPSGPPPTA